MTDPTPEPRIRSHLCYLWYAFAALTLTACGASAPVTRPAPAPAQPPAAPADANGPGQRVLAPAEAYARGWMPLKSTGVDRFLQAHPEWDGRGVLIGILDSGLDPSVPGLTTTSTGQRKVLDLRDFSGEGSVPLTRVAPNGDQLVVSGRTYAGAGRLRALALKGEMWAGTIAEIPLGPPPASDLNGDNDDADTLAVVVARASDGWVLFADTDGDGSFANEKPVHDYLVAREYFGWHGKGRAAPVGIAANFSEDKGAPRLDLFFDTSAHGSHVSGIAAANDIYGVKGFDGVAPGANLIGLKIANNAQGGISTTGSMISAIDYAIRFAADRRLPLVLNMSFGVGNEAEGAARMDQLIDSVLAAHPEVVFAISAGNDGPGLSTMGFPGSASRALTVGATFPGVFLGASGKGGDPIAYFSSRGGELAKPDIVTPGMAYSTVPNWSLGNEQKGGTSMASPHAAGLAALLVSALVQERRPVDARQIRQALMVTARPVGSETYLDDGTGLADVDAAWRWLDANRQVPDVAVRATANGKTAAYRGRGFANPADTLQTFEVTLPGGAPEAAYTLRSSAPWLHAPGNVRLRGGANSVALSYQARLLSRPGVYTGVVTGWTADTLLGPVFRLVNTVVVPQPGTDLSADLGSMKAGQEGRVFFEARAGRPFNVTYSAARPGEQVLAYLHEPGGQPYREDNGFGAGSGDQAAVISVDGRDVVPGFYEAIAVAPPLDGASATVEVSQSPFQIDAARTRDGVAVDLVNLTGTRADVQPFVVLVGAERTVRVVTSGSNPERIRFALPSWAVHAVVDVSMDREQWPRFTDFGLTVFDRGGRQLGQSPLNYAFGRVHIELSPDSTRREAQVGLFPGFADPTADQRWTALVSIRLYADSARVSQLPGPRVTANAGQKVTATVPWHDPGLPMGDGFFPLGIVVVPDGERAWTREAGLPSPVTPISQ
ncbi:MAG TPA: S8 family serine peptidase [Gemmatimonadales bacterium]|nr:S8 family serine peptidase [Gemmatimonadales bacterium]